MKAFITSWSLSGSDGGAWLAQHQLRHEIFISRMSYEVPSADTLEYDQFDTPRATYIVVMDDALEQALACCRLLPISDETMVSLLWPELLGDLDISQGRYLEATRFGTRREAPPDVREAAWDLTIQTIIEYSCSDNFEGIVGVMPKALFRTSFVRRGYVVNYLAEPLLIDGRKTVAGLIDIAASIEMRKRTRAA